MRFWETRRWGSVKRPDPTHYNPTIGRLILLVLLTLAPAATPARAQSTSSAADILAAENLFWTIDTPANTAALARQFTPGFHKVAMK